MMVARVLRAIAVLIAVAAVYGIGATLPSRDPILVLVLTGVVLGALGLPGAVAAPREAIRRLRSSAAKPAASASSIGSTFEPRPILSTLSVVLPS